jgi:hypothetical protein
MPPTTEKCRLVRNIQSQATNGWEHISRRIDPLANGTTNHSPTKLFHHPDNAFGPPGVVGESSQSRDDCEEQCDKIGV